MMKDNNVISDDSSLVECIRAIRLVVFDFDGVFTNNMVYVFEDGSEAVRCFRGDGIGLRKLERLGIETLILSTEINSIVSARSHKLGVRCVQGCEDKLAELKSITQDRNLSLAQVAFVGNDVNDLPCLRCVGLPIIVQDAHPDLIPYARYQTKAKGGYGAVREICDLFERTFASRG
jgi:YrbI family 3-deoxy-D-manno-octulosonate 8-phosphate phosphatase